MKNIFYTLTIITFIILTNSCAKPLEACFTYSPTTITITTVITFNASCSQNASSFIWHFGDNTTDTTSYSPAVTHKYSTAGTYTVILNVEREDGMSLKKGNPQTQQTITVQ